MLGLKNNVSKVKTPRIWKRAISLYVLLPYSSRLVPSARGGLGCVDLEFDSSAICLILPVLMLMRECGRIGLATCWNNETMKPNLILRADGTSCRLQNRHIATLIVLQQEPFLPGTGSRPQFSWPLFEDDSPLIDDADRGAGGGGKWPLVAPAAAPPPPRFIMDSAFANWLSMKAAVSRLNWL